MEQTSLHTESPSQQAIVGSSQVFPESSLDGSPSQRRRPSASRWCKFMEVTTPEMVKFEEGFVLSANIDEDVLRRRRILIRWIQFQFCEIFASLSLGAFRAGIAVTSLVLNVFFGKSAQGFRVRLWLGNVNGNSSSLQSREVVNVATYSNSELHPPVDVVKCQ